MIQIASIQLNSQNVLEDNLATITSAVQAAKFAGADLVVLPENACLMGRQSAIAQSFDRLSDFFCKLAKDTSIHLIAGTLPCPLDRAGKALIGDKFFQTSLAFDNQGALIGRYDKLHLFRATVKDGIGSYDEGQTFLAGDLPVVAKFEVAGQFLNVGMMICFDLRFPKLAQLYRQLGVDILVAPSAFTFLTGQANWQTLLQARALDSQCLVVGAAQGGTHYTKNSVRQTWGHSMIVQADGQVIANTHATEISKEGYLMVMAAFDPQLQSEIRQNLPIFDCQRLT